MVRYLLLSPFLFFFFISFSWALVISDYREVQADPSYLVAPVGSHVRVTQNNKLIQYAITGRSIVLESRGASCIITVTEPRL